MSGANPVVIAALNRRYFQDYPYEAAALLEGMAPEEGASLLALQPPHVVVRVWQSLGPDVARAILERVPDGLAVHLLSEADPAISVSILAQWDADERERRLASLDPQVAHELREQLAYPENSAGRLMDHKLSALRAGLSVGQALARLRTIRQHGLRELFVVDDQGKLTGRVEIQDLAVADPGQPLREIVRPLLAAVSALDPREDVAAILEHRPITELPVVNVEGRFVGIIRHATLLAAVEEETTIDIQTMVGASRDERALSSPLFAVRKRLPWLQINLLTAFLAAAVVGMFEGTIAKVTALAVLLPVVAGQSGNAGAQALAVTMRGLVLREISLRHWPRVVGKEAGVGLVNGLAVAATTAVGVYAWSGSIGLVMVITSSMVIAMVIAGIAGALVPIVLSRFGMDPAQSSSIVLTTVTDVAGFFSFLGIATLLADRLV
ncbi:MAG: magnesium transporter [Sulfuritalea sp.]|nr:magnesium transporter [Sulfuritalea sp.]